MLIVAIDTSGRGGSIALSRGDGEHFETLQLTSLDRGMYSAQLMPSISEALVRNKFDKKDIDGFVVVSGPGSFTGLRVGLSTVKALCEVLRKPLANVSMLEAIVIIHGCEGETVIAILDAGRNEVFVGEYRVQAKRAELLREFIAKVDVLAGESALVQPLFTPDAKVADALRPSHPHITLVPAIQADKIGRIGLHKLLAGDTADPATIDANYIRRSDAELFAPKR